MKSNVYQTLILSVTLIAGVLLTVQSNQSSNLEQRVATLERKVAALETKVSTPTTSGATTQRPAATSGEVELWKDKSNWRKLERGMTMDQVRRLLGEPRTVDVNGISKYWRYSTSFSPHVHYINNRLDGWDEGN